MYLRHTTVNKNGKTHTYWRLVRSVRAGAKVRQETVAYLGELDSKGRAKASALARHFLGERAEQLDFFEDRSSLEVARVYLDKVHVERGRIFGDVWLAWALWKALHLDKFWFSVMEPGREAVAVVCFLGYVMWKTLAGWQAMAQLGSSPRTLLEEFRRIQSVDVVLPLDSGQSLRLRCVVEPDKAQRILLQRLGLRLPKRLKAPAEAAKM